jgi:phosphate transport system permease protein
MKSLMNNDRHMRSRYRKNKIAHAIFLSGTLFSILMLIILLSDIVIKGLPRLSGAFFTNYPSRFAEQSGILPALVGSLWLIGLTILIAVPIGIGAAIYLECFAKPGRVSRLIQLNIANLAGVPSIVYGMLGLSLFVRSFNIGRSILSGALTMSLLILPILIVASREAIHDVPKSIIAGSYATGATKLQTVLKMILPYSFPRILTGIILAVSRAAGETAPLLLIGAFSFIRFLPENIMDAFTVMPIQIYVWAAKPQADFREVTSAAILVLMVVLLLINALAIFLRNKYEMKTDSD